jgi:hypothetical protein
LNIQSDLFSYQTNRAMAQYDARVARARLMASMGQLASLYVNSPQPKMDGAPITISKAPTNADDVATGTPVVTQGLRGAQTATTSTNWMNSK